MRRADIKVMVRRYQQDGAVATDVDLARLTALLGHPPLPYRAFAEEAAAGWSQA